MKIIWCYNPVTADKEKPDNWWKTQSVKISLAAFGAAEWVKPI
jgi:hypothetical protein